MNTKKYTLHEVTTPRDVRAWIDFPKKGLYKEYPNWVCPLDTDIEKVFDPKHNELFDEGEAIRWVVRNAEGQIVGRIGAFYNREKASIEEQPTGGCGFFESIDDQEVANLLFDASRDWLKARGMEAMDGPINFGQRRDWWGLLVKGFEYQPLYMNPYNPPYYQALFENYGFKNYFNQNSYDWAVGESEASSRLQTRSERLLADPSYHVEPIDTKHMTEAAENFRTIYNKAWALFSGVKPMTAEEAQQMMKTILPIVDPRIIFFAYHNEEPIGFFITVPDLNRLIGKFNGKFGLWQQLRLMWDLKVRKSCDRVFGIIFGITPDYQGKGVESAIMYRYLQFVQSPDNQYKNIELAWIGDFNPVMNRMIINYAGATCHKVHTTYRYLFDREKEFKRCPRLGLKRNKE
ncbi:MAG: hypothetical protein IJ478_06040 [Alistipes sp.]|nr:hypothetical protein [Alistipes sp.]